MAAESWFEGIAGVIEGDRYVLGKQTALIGRDQSCQIRLTDARVSRIHAQVEWSEGRHMITDRDSINGTFLNGTRIKEATLRPGDQIEIGDAVLRYHGRPAPQHPGVNGSILCRYCGRVPEITSTICPGCGAPA